MFLPQSLSRNMATLIFCSQVENTRKRKQSKMMRPSFLPVLIVSFLAIAVAWLSSCYSYFPVMWPHRSVSKESKIQAKAKGSDARTSLPSFLSWPMTDSPSLAFLLPSSSCHLATPFFLKISNIRENVDGSDAKTFLPYFFVYSCCLVVLSPSSSCHKTSLF